MNDFNNSFAPLAQGLKQFSASEEHKIVRKRKRKRKRKIITRKRYTKQLIVGALGNLTAIFITPYLFGEPWSTVPMRLMAFVGGFGLFALWTWTNWPTNIDDDDE